MNVIGNSVVITHRESALPLFPRLMLLFSFLLGVPMTLLLGFNALLSIPNQTGNAWIPALGIGVLFGIIWPVVWTACTFIFAVVPRFGRTVVTADREHLIIRRYVFFWRWRKLTFANDGTTRLSLGMTTERREKGKVIQVHQVRLSDSRRNTILHESRDQTKEQTLLRLLESMRSGI